MTVEVEGLPDCVLVKLFSFLDAKSLNNSMLVCQKWNRLIASSTKCKFKLILNDDFSLCPRVLWEEKLTEILGMRRKFWAIECVSSSVFIDRNKVELFTKVVKKHGGNVTHVDIKFFRFDNFPMLLKLLNSLPKMENFNFSSCGLSNKNFDYEPIVLPKLKVLTFEDSDASLLKCFKAINLNSFQVAKIDGNSVAVVRFLLAFPKLDSIVCRDLCSFELMFPYKIDQRTKNSLKYPFRLKTMKIYGPYDELARHNVFVLFKSQGKFLQELFLEVIIDEVILRLIFKSLRKLKSLTVSVDDTQTYSDEFYNDFKPVYKLRKLKIDGVGGDCIKAVLKNSPKLQEFAAHDLCSLQIVSELNSKIKKLSIQCVNDSSVKFDNLEELRVEEIIDDNALIMFMLNNKTKSLGIKFINDINLIMLRDIVEKTGIYHLTIECPVRIAKEVYEIFKEKPQMLRSLTLSFFTRVASKSYFYEEKLVRKEIKLKIPRNEENFKLNCDFFDNFEVKDASMEA